MVEFCGCHCGVIILCHCRPGGMGRQQIYKKMRRKYARTLLTKTEAKISSNDREEFHIAYRRMYRLGYRRVAAYYINLWIFYKEFWVMMEHNG